MHNPHETTPNQVLIRVIVIFRQNFAQINKKFPYYFADYADFLGEEETNRPKIESA
jgi:hypothetical protein